MSSSRTNLTIENSVKVSTNLNQLNLNSNFSNLMSVQKTILILGRYVFPYHEWVYPEHTKVLFTAKENSSFLDTTSDKQFRHIEYFEDYETNGNVELKAIELNKIYNFTHVIFQAEQDIIRAARIRDYLKLPGQTIESALIFRDKCIMKEKLNKNLTEEAKKVLSVPKFKRVENVKDIFDFLISNPFPVVIKPTRGMGATNTHIIKNDEEFKNFLQNGISLTLDGAIDYEIEQFIEGQMYHIDGFVGDGVVKLIWPSVYVNTCVGYLNSKFLGSHSLTKDNPLTPRLIDCVNHILTALEGPSSYSFHVEVFHTPEDTLVFCEAACRTGGAGVAGVMLELFEVSLNKASIQSQCGDKPLSPLPDSWKTQKQPEQSLGWIVVYPKIGNIKSIPKECPLGYVIDYEPTHKKSFISIAHCTDALSSFIIQTKTEVLAKESIQKSVEWFLKNTIWEDESL